MSDTKQVPSFAERLAAQAQQAPACESFPYGKPVPADAWAHVAARGHRSTVVTSLSQHRKAKAADQLPMWELQP